VIKYWANIIINIIIINITFLGHKGIKVENFFIIIELYQRENVNSQCARDYYTGNMSPHIFFVCLITVNGAYRTQKHSQVTM